MSGKASLAGHHALVTGSGSGIGAAIARALSGAGANVSLAGRRRDPLAETAASLAGKSAVIDSFDVTDETSIAAGLASARAAFGPVTILINNAGVAETAPFARTTKDMWSRLLAVDLTGVFNVTQAALADVQARGEGGRIISVASTAGLKGYAYVTAYCAAKHGVVGLTRALALELARTGVTVNAVCPGFTETPMVATSIAAIMEKTGRSEADARAELVRHNPQARLVQPDEVAATVLWLAGAGAQSITGQAIAVAGGEGMAG